MRTPCISHLILIAVALLVCSNRAPAATEMPIAYAGGMIWVKVHAAGANPPLNFLLDSGAGATVLDLTTARRLGVKLGRPEDVQGVDGRAVAYRVSDFDGSIGGMRVPRSVLALDLSSVSADLPHRIDGLLGSDFFRDRIIQIDYRAGKLRCLANGDLHPAGCEILPLANRNDAMCVRVSVAGQAAEWIRLDTGCSSALRWVVTPPKRRKLSATSIGTTGRSGRSLLADVKLGSTRLESVKVGIHEHQIFPGESGLLGNGVLSRFTVTIDAKGKRLILARR